MIKGLGCALLLCAAACTTRPPATAPPATAGPSSMVAPRSTAELAAAIDSAAARSDNEPDPKIRAELAAQAVSDADTCLAHDPQAAACLYGRAVARGLNARAHPTHAGEILSSMLEDLARAESADSYYDEAGPARVRALVLIRAPGWPLGPGDPEAGLVAARRAVALRPRIHPTCWHWRRRCRRTGTAAPPGKATRARAMPRWRCPPRPIATSGCARLIRACSANERGKSGVAESMPPQPRPDG